MTRVRAILADDNAPMIAALRALLSDQDWVEVIEEARNGSEALEKAIALKPDLIVMDVRMPGMDGITATRRITDALPQTVVVGFSAYDDPAVSRAMADAGARACLSKKSPPDALVAGLHRAVESIG